MGVTLVCPGYVKTELSMNALTGSGSKYATMDATTASGMEPSALAADILQAVASNTKEITKADLKTRAAIWLRTLAPEFVAKQMVKRARKQRLEKNS